MMNFLRYWINMRREKRALLLCVIAATFFLWTLQTVIAERHQTRLLINDISKSQQKERELQNEKRNLYLEYATLTDYGILLSIAVSQGMEEPSLENDTLIFIEEQP